MPTKKLTARTIPSLEAPTGAELQRDYWDTELPGFGLRVSSTGRRTWVVRYRVEGERRLRRLSLKPVYPDLSLADAREKARKALNQASDGGDPAAKKRARREAGTFAELAAEYMRRHANPAGRGSKAEKTADAATTDVPVAPAEGGESAAPGTKKKRARKGKKSWKEDRRIINNVLLAKDGAGWRHRKADDITRDDTQELHDDITDRGADVMANRVLALVSKIFNFGIARGLVKNNPAHLIGKNPEESRARVLADAEIRELWAALGETERTNADGRQVARLNGTLNDAFKASFYTAQRSIAEVFRMRWLDVDLETAWWEIPGEFTKNGETHRVPLSPAAVELLAERLAVARSGALWVFENVQPSKKPGRSFGNVAARGKKAAAFLSRGDAHLKNRRARSRKRLPFLPGLSFAFRVHDIRRTCGTNMTKAGVRREDVSKLLNHVDRGARATKVYDRYEYDAEKRAAIEVWARKLDTILNGTASASVLPFAQVARGDR